MIKEKSARHCDVVMRSEGKDHTFQIRRGFGFQALEARHDTPMEFDCRKSNCGICVFRVSEGKENLSAAGDDESNYLKAMGAEEDERLGCQCRVLGDVTIELENY